MATLVAPTSDAPASLKATGGTKWEEEAFQDKLRFYYGRLFPSQLFFDWLSYGTGSAADEREAIFSRREFSFTLEGDIYIRYKSFADAHSLQKELSSCLPIKIDLGAVFTIPPKDKPLVAPEKFQTVQRELVFDIDLTDYDEVRTCCSAANICEKCWNFMTVAVKIMDCILRDSFGFEHLLWVYSGRRGIHCWVCDEKARFLTNEQRSSVAEFMQVVTGGDQNQKKTNLWGRDLHPTLQHVYDKVLVPAFEKIAIEQQDLLKDATRWNKVLDLLDEGLRAEVEAEWKKQKKMDEDKGMERWNLLQKVVEKYLRTSKPSANGRKAGNPLHEIIFTLIYPRLDINVSKHQNHLLKAPFCIHPKTGRVCVPFDPEQADQFDPREVPTIDELLTQLNEYDELNPNTGGKIVRDYKKTAMKDCVQIFKDKFLTGLQQSLRESRHAHKRAADEIM